MNRWTTRVVQSAVLASVTAFLPAFSANAEALRCDVGQQTNCYNQCYVATYNCTHDGGEVLGACGGGCYFDSQGGTVCDSGVICRYEH